MGRMASVTSGKDAVISVRSVGRLAWSIDLGIGDNDPCQIIPGFCRQAVLGAGRKNLKMLLRVTIFNWS